MSRIKNSMIEYSTLLLKRGRKSDRGSGGNLRKTKHFHVLAVRFEDAGERIIDGTRSWGT